jgi:hypothetical protein
MWLVIVPVIQGSFANYLVVKLKRLASQLCALPGSAISVFPTMKQRGE